MKKILYKQKNHMIDTLFPLALFFVFALCSLAVLLTAVTVYRNTLSASAKDNSAQTAMAYISEKIHQNDAYGQIRVADKSSGDELPEDIDRALTLEFTENDTVYCTYIYLYDGYMCELMAAEDSTVGASAGTKIIELTSLDIENISDNLLKISCTDSNGMNTSGLVAVKSVSGGDVQ